MRHTLTREERAAQYIGRSLARSLIAIENFDGDPELILEEAEIALVDSAKRQAAGDAVKALRAHYCGEEGETP